MNSENQSYFMSSTVFQLWSSVIVNSSMKESKSLSFSNGALSSWAIDMAFSLFFSSEETREGRRFIVGV